MHLCYLLGHFVLLFAPLVDEDKDQPQLKDYN